MGANIAAVLPGNAAAKPRHQGWMTKNCRKSISARSSPRSMAVTLCFSRRLFPAHACDLKQIGHPVEGHLSIIAPSKMLTFSFPDALDELEKAAKVGKPYSLKQPGNRGNIVCEASKVIC